MFLSSIYNYVFPNVCGICENKIKNDTYTCTTCLNILKYYKIRVEYTKDLDVVYSLFDYEGIIKKRLLLFKFSNKKYIHRSFAELISLQLEKLDIEFDIIIPVPISRNRYFERGYNQSSLIAKCLEKLQKKKCLNNVLIKIKDNKKQSLLNIQERKNNVKGVYKVINCDKIKNKRILLIDDIYTTGATVKECIRVLRESGVESVVTFTIAHA